MIAKLTAALLLLAPSEGRQARVEGTASVAGASLDGTRDTQEAEVRKILDAYQSARPPVKDLGWYQLDWMATLKEAREKASKERRPICLLVCINVFGNMITGHC